MKKFIFNLLAFLFLTVAGFCQTTTVTIAAEADNTIYENPSGNSNALGQNLFSGTNGGGSPRRSLIKFNMASVIPGGATITSVTLTLNCNLSRAVADTVFLHKVISAWGEGTSNAGASGDGAGVTATFNDATWIARLYPANTWTTPGGDFNPTPSASVLINTTGFFSWSTADMVADAQNWLMVPATNNGWILLCNETTTATARKFASRENATAVNRPSLTVTYSTTLPVTLTFFKAKEISNRVVLNWETSQEINNHYFDVMHSNDGYQFFSIGRLDGHGTSSAKHQYQFIHKANLIGSHFYKLVQVDFNGSQKQSQVEKVDVTGKGIMSIVPNPVLNSFTISSTPDLQNMAYKIFNEAGAVMASGSSATGSLKVDNLKAATYYLCLYKNKELLTTIRFCKL